MVWEIPENAKFSFHAMALDEVRATFALIRPKRTTYEVWFRGAHANIGGGYLDRGLADIALVWMMEMAVWRWPRAGRKPPQRFDEALGLLHPGPRTAPDWSGSSLETLEPNPDGTIGRPASLRGQAWRELPADALIHHSVLLRQKNLVSDHLRSNRPLVRRIPASVRPVYDPPLFYDGTVRQAAERLAGEAFSRVPIRPQSWLMYGAQHVFRSDDWIAVGSELGRVDPKRWVERATREAFLRIAIAWILGGRPADYRALDLTVDLPNRKGQPIPDPSTVMAWVVPVLCSLAPYLPWKAELSEGRT